MSQTVKHEVLETKPFKSMAEALEHFRENGYHVFGYGKKYIAQRRRIFRTERWYITRDNGRGFGSATASLLK